MNFGQCPCHNTKILIHFIITIGENKHDLLLKTTLSPYHIFLPSFHVDQNLWQCRLWRGSGNDHD